MTEKKTTANNATRAKKAPAKATASRATPAKKATPAKRTAAKKGTASRVTPAKKGGPAKTADAATKSRFFQAAHRRAHKVVNDPERLHKIAEDAAKTSQTRLGPFTAVLDDFRALIRLVVAYARGHYREIPADALVVIVAGLIYVVSPFDLIPDLLPGGFADDAVVVGWVIKTVRGELESFRAWELGAATKGS